MKNIFRLVRRGGFLFVVFCLFTTTNPLHAQWIQIDGNLINCFAVSPNGTGGTNLFAGTNGVIFRSTDNGTDWTAVNTGLDLIAFYALAVSPNGTGSTNLFAGTSGGGVWFSTNNGTSWKAVKIGLTNTDVRALAFSDTNLFAGTWGGGVYRSTDSGTNWTAVNTGLMGQDVHALTVSGTNLFAMTDGGVSLSTNNGTRWSSTGLTGTGVYALAVSGANLVAGTYGGVWIRPLSEMITSVEGGPTDLPSHFSLGQNFPNPFNPSTNISFSLPSKSFVSLKVFDALGKEVETPINQEKPAGTYQVSFDASKLSSGVYFYRLMAGGFTQVKKMLMMK